MEHTNALSRIERENGVAASTAPDRSHGKPRILIVDDSLTVGNAWKFTDKTAQPRVEVGALARSGQAVDFIRGNGVGFDSANAKKLFRTGLH